MTGWLVYYKEDADKNEWFIHHLENVGRKYDLIINTKIITENDFVINEKMPDFVINRTRNAKINKIFEKKNIPCFNNSRVVEIANDKYKTYLYCKKLGIPVMKTELFENGKENSIEYPCVLKTVNGHGGSEVFMVNSATEAQHKADELKNKSLILQELSTDVGVDMRVYVVGGKITACAKRQSENDFRSNYSLGGKFELAEASSNQAEIIALLQKNIKSDYIGVDFIRHNGNWVLNEIEDAAGARMVYSLSDFDIAEEFIKHICETLQM